MASFNKVVLLGNLTRDPEIKKSPAGVTVAKLRLAVNETYRDRQTGQPKEVACFVDVAVWDKQAESCAQYLTRGSQILVEGRLIYEEWKNAQGESRNRLSVRADRVQFINTVRRPDGAPAPAGQVHSPVSQAQGSAPAGGPTSVSAAAPVSAAPAPASAPATSAEPPLDDVPF
jgi:single-strand DNA-binding protein